jgi:hypothetical protein
MAITVISGIVQANSRGVNFILAFTVTTTGLLLSIALIITSIISVIKNRKQPSALSAPVPESTRYKRGFVWSVIVAAPGILIWLSAAFTTRNGGGEAYILFIPLLFVSFIALFAALLYGVAYIFKREK